VALALVPHVALTAQAAVFSTPGWPAIWSWSSLATADARTST